MDIFSTILMTIGPLLIGVLTLAIFIQTNKELWEDSGKDLWGDVKSWYKNTRLYMWNKNRKNGVKILSEREYNRLLRNGQIKYVIIEEED